MLNKLRLIHQPMIILFLTRSNQLLSKIVRELSTFGAAIVTVSATQKVSLFMKHLKPTLPQNSLFKDLMLIGLHLKPTFTLSLMILTLSTFTILTIPFGELVRLLIHAMFKLNYVESVHTMPLPVH